MNIKTPLAAALLMLASSAMAQLALTPPSLGAGTFGDSGSSLSLGLYSGKIPDDASFNCSTYYNMNFSLTVKFEMCTPEQERARLSFLGLCPLGNMACRNYMNRIMLPANSSGFELLGAKDSGPNVPCQVPPCLNAAAAPEEIAEAPAPQPGSGEIYGPPLPPGFNDAQGKKTLEKARKEIGTNGVKDVVDLGNGNIAKMRDDGTVQMCGGAASACAEPVPADSINNPKIQAWVADNKGGFVGLNQNPGGKAAQSSPGRNKGAPEPSGTGAPADSPPGGSSSDQDSGGIAAYNMGRSLGDETGALSGPGGPSSSGRGSSASGSYGAQAASGKAEKVDQAEFKKLLGSPDSFTYPVLGALSEKAAAEINPNVFDAEAKAKQDSKVELKFRGIQTESQ